MNVLRKLFDKDYPRVYIHSDERGDWFAVGPTAEAVCFTEETHTDRTRLIKTEALAHREATEAIRKYLEHALH